MDTRTKAQLKQEIQELPKHYQPKWLYKATKDEMRGWLLAYNQLMDTKGVSQ